MENILAGAIAAAILLFVAGGRYMLNRLNRLESESEARLAGELVEAQTKAVTLTDENSKLLFRIATLESKVILVDELSKQIIELRTQVSDVRCRLDKTEDDLKKVTGQKDGLQHDLDKAQAEINRRDLREKELLSQVHDLKVAQSTYDKVLALIGMERNPKTEPQSPLPGESVEVMKVEETKPQ